MSRLFLSFTLLFLPRTQTSLSCAQRKAGRLCPSHCPLRLITSRSPLPCEKRSGWGGFEEEAVIVCCFEDKASTSASPSRELNFQDGVPLLFSSFIPWFSTFCRFKMLQWQYFELFDISSTCWPCCQRNREEKSWRGLKQTRRDWPIFKKKPVGTYAYKFEFSNFFLFQQAKMIISVLVTYMIVDCNLAVKVLLSF